MNDHLEHFRPVIAFGAFDPLHDGHRDFFRQARALGTHLTVVVARDEAIVLLKGRQPYQNFAIRRAFVALAPDVDQAVAGDVDPRSYGALQRYPFAVLALGYDQQPDLVSCRTLLKRYGLGHVAVRRLQPFRPEHYKSSYLRRPRETRKIATAAYSLRTLW